MPIGDILAQISGDKPQPSSSTATVTQTPRQNGAIKRKADDDLRGNSASKTPRTFSSVVKNEGGSTSTAKGTERPASTGYKGTSGARPIPPTPKPTGRPTAASKPGSTPVKTTNGAKSTSRTGPPGAAAPATKPLKKGSYAEILARAQKAQTTMGQVGKLQHKVTEKAKKEKGDAVDSKDGKQAAAKAGTRYNGTARPANSTSARPRPGAPGNGTNGALSKDARKGAPAPTKDSKAQAAAKETERKARKAAAATTGYTGTARPRPGATSTGGKGPINKNKKPAAPGGALLNPRATQRYGGSTGRRSRYEEEEEEDMDDFIDYDDEEEEEMGGGGPRYRYDSGSESDMEAGMDDIYDEEAEAERFAKREDQREAALEAKLKAEKEERKRRYYDTQKKR